MLSIECLNTQLIVIMNDFAKAVITQIKVQSNVEEDLEELDALVHGLCEEAINKILRIVELVATTKQHDPPSVKSEEETEDSHTDTNGINKPCGPAEEDPGDSPDGGEDGATSPSPPTPPRHQDHEYARSLSPVSADENASSATLHRKRKGRKMPNRSSQKKALKLGPEPMNHPCERCTMIFPSVFRLTEHYRKDHPECQTCGELFPGIKKLREHEIKVHGVLPYKCDYCDKGFTHKGHRDEHVGRKHTGEKPCQCDICGKAYICAAALKLHRVVHFDKSFMCDVCGKSFHHAVHLVRHKHVHEEVKPYQCPTCGKRFTQAENMMRHQAAIHKDGGQKEKQLCSVCGKSYAQESMRYHMISQHSEREASKEKLFRCDVCGKKFLHLSQCKLHKVSHSRERPFHCHVCGKTYKQKQILNMHMHTHTGETPYKCTICGKTFNTYSSSARHKSIHSGEMPFSCKECGKHFRLLTFLKAHEQTLGHRRRTSSDTTSSENTNSSRPPTAAKKKKSS